MPGLGQDVLQTASFPPAPQPSVMDQAIQQYPILGTLGLKYKDSRGANTPNMLESWPPGEPGSDDYKRPSEIPLNSMGVEVFSDKVRPIDILGDVVSHHLKDNDPLVKRAYDLFQSSLSPQQNDMLYKQYRYAKVNEGETRPFDDWRVNTGIPAYFRGYTFQQWPKEFNDKAYTPQQKALLDKLMSYLSSPVRR